MLCIVLGRSQQTACMACVEYYRCILFRPSHCGGARGRNLDFFVCCQPEHNPDTGTLLKSPTGDREVPVLLLLLLLLFCLLLFALVALSSTTGVGSLRCLRTAGICPRCTIWPWLGSFGACGSNAVLGRSSALPQQLPPLQECIRGVALQARLGRVRVTSTPCDVCLSPWCNWVELDVRLWGLVPAMLCRAAPRLQTVLHCHGVLWRAVATTCI